MKALMEQAIFFAKRLADEGVDFTSSVVEIFTSEIESQLCGILSCAVSSFSATFIGDSDRFSSELTQSILWFVGSTSSLVSQIVDEMKGVDGAKDAGGFQSSDITPPIHLMSFPPLCLLLNSIISVLTFLRACPLLRVVEDVKAHIFELLDTVIDILIEKAPSLRSLGPRVVGNVPSWDITTRKEQKSDSISHNPSRLDIMYAEAVAFDMIPHIFITFSIAIRNTDYKVVRPIYESNFGKISPSGDANHLISTTASLEAAFGASSPFFRILQAYWKKLQDYRLLSANTD